MSTLYPPFQRKGAKAQRREEKRKLGVLGMTTKQKEIPLQLWFIAPLRLCVEP